MGILCNGQDDAVVLRRRSLVLMTVMVAIVFAAAMPLSLNVGDMMFRKLLEKMVHPMRCSRGDKKPKRDGEAQVQAASEFRDWSSGIH